MSARSTVGCIREARRAGLDMREVSERLDASVGQPKQMIRWREWIRKEVLKAKNLTS
jgi:hypothetical protein